MDNIKTFTRSGATCKQLINALHESSEFKFSKVTNVGLAMIYGKDYSVEDIDFVDDSTVNDEFEISLKEDQWSSTKYKTETFKRSVAAHKLDKARILLKTKDGDYRVLIVECNKYSPAVIWFCDNDMMAKLKSKGHLANGAIQSIERRKQLDF